MTPGASCWPPRFFSMPTKDSVLPRSMLEEQPRTKSVTASAPLLMQSAIKVTAGPAGAVMQCTSRYKSEGLLVNMSIFPGLGRLLDLSTYAVPGRPPKAVPERSPEVSTSAVPGRLPEVSTSAVPGKLIICRCPYFVCRRSHFDLEPSRGQDGLEAPPSFLKSLDDIAVNLAERHPPFLC